MAEWGGRVAGSAQTRSRFRAGSTHGCQRECNRSHKQGNRRPPVSLCLRLEYQTRNGRYGLFTGAVAIQHGFHVDETGAIDVGDHFSRYFLGLAFSRVKMTFPGHL